MRSETLIIREPKLAVPDGYKKLYLDAHPLALSFISPQSEVGIDFQLFLGQETDGQPGVDLAAAFAEVETKYAEDRVFWWACKADEGDINFEGLQPFPLINEGEGEQEITKVLAILEGEFPLYDNDEEPIGTPEFKLVNTFLAPLVDELYDVVGKDIDMLMGALRKKAQADKINAVLGPRATILIVPCKGPAASFSNNTEGKVFPWGFVSKTLNYVEEEKPVTPSKGKLSLKGATPAKPKETEEQPTEEEVEPEIKFAAVLKNPDYRIVGGELRGFPPSGSNFSSGKAWWGRTTDLPRNPDNRAFAKEIWAGIPWTKMKPSSPMLDFIHKALKMDKKVPAVAETEQAPTLPAREGDVPKIKAPMTLFIPKDAKDRFMDLRKNPKNFPTWTAEQIAASQKDTPGFAAQLGEDFSFWKTAAPEAYSRLVHNVSGHSAIVLLHEMRCLILALEAAAKDKAPAVAAAPAAAPKKLSMKTG